MPHRSLSIYAGTAHLGLIAAAACALLLLASCGRPQGREYFQLANDEGEYSFDIDLSDSLASYDISFYTEIDRPLWGRDTLVCFPLQVVWRSPAGRYFSETVYYPAAESRVLYRSDVVPTELGSWNISVTIPDQPRRLRGLGIIYRRK